MDYNNNPNNFNNNSGDNNYSQNPYEPNGANMNQNPYDNNGMNMNQNQFNNNGMNMNQSPYTDNGNFSQNYHYDNVPYATAVEPKEAPVMAIVSLVLGILSIITCCFGFGAIFGLVGIILSIVALVKKKGTGFAIAGLVTSAIGFLFGAYMCFGYIAAFSSGEMNDIIEQSIEESYSDL